MVVKKRYDPKFMVEIAPDGGGVCREQDFVAYFLSKLQLSKDAQFQLAVDSLQDAAAPEDTYELCSLVLSSIWKSLPHLSTVLSNLSRNPYSNPSRGPDSDS